MQENEIHLKNISLLAKQVPMNKRNTSTERNCKRVAARRLRNNSISSHDVILEKVNINQSGIISLRGTSKVQSLNDSCFKENKLVTKAEVDAALVSMKNILEAKITELMNDKAELEANLLKLVRKEQVLENSYNKLQEANKLIKVITTHPEITKPNNFLINKSIKDSYDIIRNHVLNKELKQAEDKWKEIDYNIEGINELEAILLLRLICKFKDNNKTNDLIQEYKALNKKLLVINNIQVREIEELQGKIMAGKVFSVSESTSSLLNPKLHETLKKEDLEFNTHNTFDQRINFSSQESLSKIRVQDEVVIENIPFDGNKMRIDLLLSENAKNRKIIRELIAKDVGKLNKVLYENNVELNNKLIKYTEHNEQLKELIEELDKALSILIPRTSRKNHTTLNELVLDIIKEINSRYIINRNDEVLNKRLVQKGVQTDIVSSLETKIAYLNVKLLEADKEINRQDYIIKGKNESIEVLELEHNKFLQNIKEMENELVECRENIIKYETELKDVKLLKEELNTKNNKLNELITDNNFLKEEAEVVKQQLNDNNNKYEDYIKTVLEEHTKEIEEYRKTVSKYEENSKQIMEKLIEVRKLCVKGNIISTIRKSEDNIIEEIKNKLINDKRIIESLQSAINTLQKERQSLKLDTLLVQQEEKYKAITQRYVNWLDNIQNPLKHICSLINNKTYTGHKLSLNQIHEIIESTSNILVENMNNLKEITKENAELKEVEQKLKEEIKQLNNKIKKVEDELFEAKRDKREIETEKSKLENTFQRRHDDNNKVYEKGIFLILINSF